ncbi:MAG: nickel pincer cofactor biosynthesis protein LarC [Coriobacteriia bacterium]|nr:nickel pincer cofactor biosynthesis protein LarC [Coriobacteriia bacterium]
MIAYLDCSTGVSGDKLLGALIDAGLDPATVSEAVASMGLGNIVVRAVPCTSGSIVATGVTVTESGAPRRNYGELQELLLTAEVPEPARENALKTLGMLAEAESQVHGVAVEKVHFHEIGAADTLVDTLGVALGLHELDITELVASPVAVGGGTVVTEHGELPIPAPATALLLKGMPVVSGSVGGELTTPTGAALMAAFATGFGSIPPMTLRRVGTGCGTADLGMPNVCRLLLGEAETGDPGHEDIVVLETNIDHLTPEELAVAADRLHEAGSLDVWQTPVVMHKGRASTLLSVLATTATAPRLAERIIAETGTLGVRMIPAPRRLVERDVAEIETSLGKARFKTAYLPGTGRVLRVESDDASRIAAGHNMAVDEAARLLEQDAARATGVRPLHTRPDPEREE